MKPSGIRKFEIVAKAGEAEIFLYDQIGASFFGDGISAKSFAESFRGVGKVSRVVLRINSPGGDVFDGAAMYDIISQSEIPVDVIVDGLCASAAFTIAMAGRSIAIGEAGLMMMHNAKGGVFGDAEDMRSTAEIVDKVTKQMASIYAKRSGSSMEQVLADMDAETWMTPEEAVAKGYADKIMESAPQEDDVAARMAASFNNLEKFQHVPEAFKMRIAALATPKFMQPLVKELQSEVLNPRPKAEREQHMETAELKPAASAAVETKEAYGPVAAEIIKMGKKYGVDTTPCLRDEMSLEAARNYVSDRHFADWEERNRNNPTSGVAQPVVAGMSDKDRANYSIARAILSQVEGRRETAGLEWDVHESIAKIIGQPTHSTGIYVPTHLGVMRPRAAGLDTKTNAAGKYTVPTEVRDLIELLRNKMRLFQLGATILSGLNGNIQFPRQLTAMTASWVTENPGSDVAQTDVTFGALTLSPKTLQGTTSYSRQLLAQSSVDIENLVRQELATVHALAIDLAGINGLGTSNQPTGVLKTSGIGDVALGTNGLAPTYDSIVDLEAALANANADEDGMKFLTTPIMRAKLRKIQQFASTNGVPIWQQLGNSLGVGDVLGYPGYVSKQVPSTLVKGSSSDCHAIIFGYWPTVLVGEWGVMELVVDPYALKKQGMIEVTSFQMCDVGVRQPAQMAAIQDARNV